MAIEVKKEITITRVFDAPRELVFKAWTDPELVAKWWGPYGVTNPVSKVDPKVGGDLHIVMLAGKELGDLAGQRWPMQGVFRELKEPERLVFTNQAVDDQGHVLIDGLTTVDLEVVDGDKTKLTMTTSGVGHTEQSAQMLEGMDHGWTQSIDKLESYLAS